MVRVLFVCLGNICRSPTADGVFRRLVAEAGLARHVESDSAGITDYHQGAPPDERAAEAALRRGYDLSRMRAREIGAEDFRHFDLVLAMDRSVLHDLIARARRAGVLRDPESLRLFLEFAPETRRAEVPDPYLGGRRGFEVVLDLIEAGARGLLKHIQDTRLG